MSNNRGTVEIWNNAAAPISEERPVVLYTHWGASTLMQDVMSAIERRERWNDPAYLSRIIFCQMICGDLNPLTSPNGYGILTDNVGDAVVEIVIDCDRQEIIVKEINRDNERYTFEEFAELGKDWKENRDGLDRRLKDNDKRKITRRNKKVKASSIISSVGYRGEE
jgi:hypothetical protein